MFECEYDDDVSNNKKVRDDEEEDDEKRKNVLEFVEHVVGHYYEKKRIKKS